MMVQSYPALNANKLQSLEKYKYAVHALQILFAKNVEPMIAALVQTTNT